MKKIFPLLLSVSFLLISVLSLIAQPQTGSFNISYTDRGVTSTIAYWVPTDYDSTKSYPFLLCWHGAGDTGPNTRNNFKNSACRKY